MRIKSYYSRTVEGAIALASQEMGPDAMLVQSRRAAPEARHLGEYEVVFAADIPAESAAGSDSLPGAAPSGERLSFEVAELKKELEGMRRVLTRSAFAPQWTGVSPTHSDAYAMLTAAEVSAELAQEIAQGAAARLGVTSPTLLRVRARADAAAFQQALVEELESRFTVEPLLGKGEGTPRIVALAGPPGAGKTTTLVKLAVNYGLASRRPVLLLSMDTYRVAAAEQLRSYAAILGVGFQVLETVTALAQSLAENPGKELILIDTPGLSLGDLEEASSLARFLATRPDVDTHLVLPASMKAADLTRMVDAYQIFQPQRLLFTKLDETTAFGPLFNEAVRTAKPLSFFTSGQRIPEDLETASHERVVELLLTAVGGLARSAA